MCGSFGTVIAGLVSSAPAGQGTPFRVREYSAQASLGCCGADKIVTIAIYDTHRICNLRDANYASSVRWATDDAARHRRPSACPAHAKIKDVMRVNILIMDADLDHTRMLTY